MITKAQKVRVFIFVTLILAMLGYTIFLLVGRKLLEQEDTYFIKLKKQSVTGLSVGQDVRYYGINIGKITDISINREDISEIIVEVSIKSGTPIKNTTTAELNFLGITGLKIIELTGGENEDKDLPPNGFIQSRKGIISDITGKAEVITEKIELLLNNLIEMTNAENRELLANLLKRGDHFITNLDSITVNISEIVDKNRAGITKIITNSGDLTDSLKLVTENINHILGSFSQLTDHNEIPEIISGLNSSIEMLQTKLIPDILNMISKTNLTITHVDKTVLRSRKHFINSMESLKETLENLNEFSRLIKENPDILIKGRE